MVNLTHIIIFLNEYLDDKCHLFMTHCIRVLRGQGGSRCCCSHHHSCGWSWRRQHSRHCSNCHRGWTTDCLLRVTV